MWKKMALTVVAVLGVAAPALAKADEPCAPVQAAYVPVTRPGYVREGDYLRWRQRERWERARRFEHERRSERGYGRRW
jgi:hypothetical protein